MIKLVRLDYRLLHGQVVFSWTGHVGAQRIIVVDDDAANDEMKKSALLLSKPAGVRVNIFTVDKAIAKMSGSEKQLCLDIPKGGEFKIVLDDSTEVWLNSESKLIYPEKFSDKERRVIVKGEAYFKVAHESNRPFRVETDGQVVTVHGTEFNVKSYKEDKNVLTTLVEGSISLSKANGSGEVMLRPGHQSQFSKQDASTTVRTVNAEMVTSWRYGKFVFENQTLEEIMQELSRWYNFEYEFSNNDLKQIEFMGSIPRYSQFDTALTILEKSGGIHFKRQGNKLRIMR